MGSNKLTELLEQPTCYLEAIVSDGDVKQRVVLILGKLVVEVLRDLLVGAEQFETLQLVVLHGNFQKILRVFWQFDLKV